MSVTFDYLKNSPIGPWSLVSLLIIDKNYLMDGTQFSFTLSYLSSLFSTKGKFVFIFAFSSKE